MLSATRSALCDEIEVGIFCGFRTHQCNKRRPQLFLSKTRSQSRAPRQSPSNPYFAAGAFAKYPGRVRTASLPNPCAFTSTFTAR
jgi:hypothetical protein